jgi:hypothetical protein
VKIAIHCNQFDGRGSGKVPLDYADALSSILGHEPIFITSLRSKNEGLSKIKPKYHTVLYDKKPAHEQSITEQLETKQILSTIVENEKVDVLYMLKSGQNDHITHDNCKTGIHCVFLMTERHGTNYVGISDWIARKFGYTQSVPHIIKNILPTENLRQKLNIPADVLVVGRHGGMDTFNIEFAKEAVRIILEHRKDIYFLFLSTNKFVEHERVIFLPWVETEQDKFNFIHTCDVMLHARHGGESFGIACGEFSIANKPVITWSGIGDNWPHDKNHIEVLGDKSIIYNDLQELVDVLYNIDKSFISSNHWDKYSKDYNDISVINKFKKEFLET